MSFSDWTKKRQQQNGAATSTTQQNQQQTGMRATASPAATPSIARDDKPSSFTEWTKKKTGVSAWRDEEAGFNDWLDSLNSFSQRVSQDYASRDGVYQSADAISSYRDNTYKSIDSLSEKSSAYRQYFTAYKSMYDELYGEEAVSKILSALDDGGRYLEDIRGNLGKEYDYWTQFADEDDYKGYLKGKEYAALAEAEDFADASQYKSTYRGGEKFNAWSGTYTDSGFDDIAYDYINRDQTARDRQMLADIQSNASFLGLDNSERGEMTDDEIATFNYLYATQGSGPAYEYIDYLTSNLNYRQRQKSEAEWAAYANEHPVGSSVFSVLESPLKGISYLGQFADYTADGKIDQNEGYNKFSYLNSAIRSEVNSIVEDKWGGIGSFAYNTGMSMGDFLFNTAITGGNSALTLGIMGTGAAADATISAKDRGLSDDQAFALGTIAGAAEIITEKVSLDALLDKTSLTKSAMGYFLKNVLAEGSEEVGSDFINLFADILIAKEKSEWQLSIDAYEAEGYDETGAFWRAVRDQAETMGLDFLGGALSGGIMSGGSIGINEAGNAISAGRTGAEFNGMGEDVVLATIQTGLESDPSTESYKLAAQLRQKLDQGQEISNYELGRLYQANVRTVDAETSGEELLRQAAEQMTQGGAISNRTASDILGNVSAVNTLSSAVGLTLTDDMSKAKRRAAVKSAVEALASQSGRVSGVPSETAQVQETAPQSAVAPSQQRPVAEQAYDIKRVQRAAAALGENGAKALTAAYDGESNADSFYAGFASYYEAGISGMDMAKVQSEYDGQLNAAQKYAAYVAGQNDAAASLAAEKAGVKTATVYGKEAGFIQSDHSASMPKETVRFYNAVARAAGVKIKMAAATGESGANGWYSNGTIFIAADAENPGQVVAKHEITHRMQELAPEEYREYRDYAVNALAERDGSSAVLVEQYKARYAESGVNLNTEQAMDEIAADFTEALTLDSRKFERLAQENRSVARKLLDAIRDFIAKVKSLFNGNIAKQNQAAADAYGVDMKTLEEAAKLWTDALKATSAAAHNALSERDQRIEFSDVNTRFSIRKKDPPKHTGIAYKVFYAKDGQLYPPMVANPGGVGTPVGVWLDADIGKAGPPSKTGRAQVQGGGKGTNAGKISLAFRPGWHLGDIPLAKQFARKNPETGVKDLFPADFVWAECEYAMDVDYQEEAMSYGYTESGKFRHAYAGLPKLPEDGYYRYRTNPNPDTVPWVITGAMKVTRILTDAETDAICRENGVEPMARQGGPIDLSKYGLEAGDTGGNTRFSMKSPVEKTKNLLALHNLTERNLLDALKLGGLPMPSIAVVKAQQGHAKYGPISLVFSKDTIDPRASSKNRVYGGDAYTPTAPTVDRIINMDVERRVSRSIMDLAQKTADGIFAGEASAAFYFDDSYTSKTQDDILDDLAGNNGVKAAYLADQGKTLEPVIREKANQYDTFGNEALKSLEESVGAQELAAMFARVESGEGLTEADTDAVRAAIRGALEQRPGDFSSTPEQKAKRIELRLGKLTPERMGEFVRNAQWLYEDGMPTTEQEVDRYATMDALREAAPDDAVRAWVRPQIEGLLGEAGIYNGKERYTPSGNRKGFSALHNPYTLENIVKAMASQQSERGEATWGVTAKALQSVATPSYKSIRDIKADSGRLGTADEAAYNAQTKAIDDKIMEIIQQVKGGNKSHSDNPFTESDIIGDVMISAARGTKTVDGIMRTFSREGYTISSQTAQDIQSVFKAAAELPTEYFEAKPRRAVGFDEVLAAVVPDDASDALRSALSTAGVSTLEYKSGDDSDRLEKVNSVEGARFSLKTDSEGRNLTAAQQEYFKDSKAVDGQGRLLVLYHISDAKGIHIFQSGNSAGLIYFALTEADARAAARGKTQVYECYLNVTNPVNNRDTAIDWYNAEDSIHVANWKRAGHDGVYVRDESGVSIAVFSPERIKLTDNKSPTDDPDIRRSLKGGGDIQRDMASLQEENILLKDRVEYWRGQTRRTKRITTDKKAVTNAARTLIRSYGADLETGDIAGDLQSLYDYMASGSDGKDELTYSEARRRAGDIARRLVENAVVTDNEMYQTYSDLRAYLRTAKLTLSEKDSHDIPDYGDFRKRNFGRLNLGKGDTNIDQAYQEMSSMWPEFFDEQRESNPVDQLLRIVEVLDGIYDITEYNPFSRYMDQAVSGAANDIIETFFDLPQTRATFADRQARKLDDAKAKGRQRVQQVRAQKDARIAELRAQNKERVQQAIHKERTRRETQIDKLKTHYQEKDAAGRERRSARELRAKIVRHARGLSQKLLRPSDKQHIPESLRQATAAALDAINLESAFSVDPETGKRVKDGSGTPTKRTEAFRKLRLAYADIVKEGGDYTLVIDPDLMDNLNELEAMKDTPLAQMGTSQLSTVWATIKAVEASIRTANKMLGTSRFETISQFAEGIKNDNILRSDRGDFKGLLGKMDKLANLDMLTPQGYFHRMGSTGEELFRMMRAAQDRHISIMRDAQQATEKIVGKADINKLEREVHTFTVNGERLTMSTAQIMSLYELMKREQAQEHIFVGGIRPDAINTRRGLRESRRSAPVRITVEDFATITGVLTDEQIKMADGLQRYMGGALAELGNEASMEVYGYRKFNEKDYFPIQVDKNQTKKDITKEAQAATIAGRGFTKSVAPKANNAVMVNSIFDIYASHVNDMATYAAWLPTMENVRRIRDFTFRDGEGNRIGDIKTVIERVFGKNGNAYLNRLVDDINQGVRSNGTGNLTDGIVSNYKAAAVAANIRVILQQPTAILRSLDMLDAKYLLGGAVKRGDWAKVKKYAPIAVWKDWGYFDINTGRQMKDVLLGSDTVLEKVRQAGMAMAGKADSFAWARLWNAVELEIKDKRPGLKPGTDAFYKAVAERFSEIVDRTQVVDGLLQRSQIMRSPDALTKMSTSFMAEPTKTYNMFVNAVYDARHATGKEGRNRAKRALARTSTALVVSFTVNALVQAVVDALRDDDKEKDYWEKMLQAFTGFSGDEESFLDYWNSFWSGNLEANFNPLSYLPYFKDLISIAQGYDVTRMDMEAVEKVWTAATNMKKALTGEGRYTLAGASANLLAEVSRLLGLPVANLKRDVQAGVTTAAVETDNYLLQYRIDSVLLDIGYSGNTGNFMDILYNASINDREAYEIIYADMVERGVGEDKIRSAMEGRMKRDQGVESVEELERRYLTPVQERTYSGVHGEVAGTSIWNAATKSQRSSLEADLYNLTVGNDTGAKLREKIDGGASYGISEADYLLYRLAQDVVSQDGNSNTSQDEAEAAIAMLVGLSDEARAYLWQSTNKGWAEENNPFK